MKIKDLIVTLAIAGALALGGCKKKQPKPVASAPEILQPAPAQPEPVASSPASEPLPTASIEDTTPVPEPNHDAKPSAPKPRKTRNAANSKPAAKPPVSQGSSESAEALPPKITTDGGTSPPPPDGAISTGAGHSDEQHQRQTTAQLLQATEENLRSVKRQLSNDEEALVARIRSFMAESRTATEESDGVRAHNLALKAHLLSDELVRQ